MPRMLTSDPTLCVLYFPAKPSEKIAVLRFSGHRCR